MTSEIVFLLEFLAGVAVYQLFKRPVVSWFAERKKRRAEQMFRAGFDYAAGMIMRHYGDEKVLTMLEHQADDPWSACDFNKGMMAAIRAHCQREDLIPYE